MGQRKHGQQKQLMFPKELSYSMPNKNIYHTNQFIVIT